MERFLTRLATIGKVAPSTHKQALAAILFLYREVLSIDLPWLGETGRPRTPVRMPVVVSREEVALLLSRARWTQDRAAGLPGVELPDALARKLGRAGESLSRHWVFPSPLLSTNPRSPMELLPQLPLQEVVRPDHRAPHMRNR